MVVAHSAAAGESQERLDRRAGAIDCVAEEELVVDRSTFGGRNVAAVKAGGYKLRLGRVFEQIAGELFDGEFIEGHVGVEGTDNPIAIGPNQTVVVQVQPVGVSVTGHIEPMPRHLFTVMRGVEILIDEFLVSLGRWVLGKAIDILDAWRQSRQGECQPTGEGSRVGRSEHFKLSFGGLLLERSIDPDPRWRVV